MAKERLKFFSEFLFDAKRQLFLNVTASYKGKELPLDLSSLSIFLYKHKQELTPKDQEFCLALGKLLKKIIVMNRFILGIQHENDMIAFFRKAAHHKIHMRWRRKGKKTDMVLGESLPFQVEVTNNKGTLIVRLLNRDRYMQPLGWLSFFQGENCVLFSHGMVHLNVPKQLYDFMSDLVDKPKLTYRNDEILTFVRHILKPHRSALAWKIKTDLSLMMPKDTLPEPILSLTYEQNTLQPLLSIRYGATVIPPNFDGDTVKDRKDGTLYVRKMKMEQKFQEVLMKLFEQNDLPFLLQSPADIARFMSELVPSLTYRGWEVQSNVPDFEVHPDPIELSFDIQGDGKEWFSFGGSVDVLGNNMTLQETARMMIQNQGFLKTKSGFVKLSESSQSQLTLLSDMGALHGKKFTKAELLPMLTAINANAADAESKTYLDSVQNIQGVSYCNIDEDFNGTLRDYQQFGVNWLHFLKSSGFGGILADDMGLGKTIQTIAYGTQLKNKGPILIVGPTNVIYNWKREIETFSPDKSIVIYTGGNRDKALKACPNPDYLITTYGIVKNDLEFLSQIRFSAIFADEAQAIKNEKAQVSKAIKSLQSEFRIALTGTPIENHFYDLWNLFDFVMPNFLGNKTQFDAALKSNKQALLKVKIKPFILRREKKEVLHELPEKTEILLTCPLSEQQEILYKTVLDATKRGIVEGGKRDRLKILTALLKLRQVCLHPGLINEFKGQNIKSSKFEMATEKIRELLDEGHKVVLFSQFTQMLDILQDWVQENTLRFHRIDGSVSGQKRQEIVEDYQSCEDASVMLISLKAGGVGINLTSADYVIHMDPWWNPAVESQATDRVHRMGQKNKVIVYKMITENTIEEKIQQLQEEKKSLLGQIIDIDTLEDKKINVDELKSILFQ